VTRPGILTATLQQKTISGVQAYWLTKTKEIQTNFSWQKANGYSFFGQKRCFAGGIHESRSNHHIKSLL